MPLQTVSLSTFASNQVDHDFLRTWKPWVRYVEQERIGADVQYGDYTYLYAMENAARQENYLKSEDYLRMKNSNCAHCREFAGQSMYPRHTPSVKGHANHCTCDYCF